MKYSLTRQMALLISAIVIGTLLACGVINSLFLEPYYMETKKRMLISGYTELDTYLKKRDIYDDEATVQVEKLSSKSNIAVLIMKTEDGKENVLISTSVDPERLVAQFRALMFQESARQDVLKELQKKSYRIEQVRDARLDSDYMILWGMMGDGNLIMLRTPLSGIKESVKVSNTFLMYVGMLAIFVSIIIVNIAARKVTKPVRKLTQIAERMSNLDFNCKYESRHKNELDMLGEHMNLMARELEKNMSELKSANNELLLDNEHRMNVERMRTEFISNVSHELKTPIALIRGYAEGLQECVIDDEESRKLYCDVIMNEARKMNDMVQKLLTLNEIEQGNQGVVMERFDLTEMIRSVLNVSGLIIEQEGIHLFFEQENPVYVWADEFKVEEAFTNYINNAIHHVSGEKNIEVKITGKEHKVRVSVFNTGSNIPAEDVNRIWEKFYKVDKARTREYGGSGIGLSIVKAIMDSFNQECGVINYSNGVEFWFELDGNESI